MKRALSVAWWLIDRVFPIARPLTSSERHEIDQSRTNMADECSTRAAGAPDAYLEQLRTDCHGALDDEQARQQSIDARLTTITGMSSIAATVVFGTLLTSIPQSHSVLLWLLLATLAYLIMQLVCAMLAAVRGLERRSYAIMASADLLPASGESKEVHQRRQVGQLLSILAQNRDANDDKLTNLAVAHCALKNFVIGLVVFATVAGIHHLTEPQADQLVARLKADKALYELIRGPQGPSGATGARGPTGMTGAQGPTGVTTVTSSNTPNALSKSSNVRVIP